LGLQITNAQGMTHKADLLSHLAVLLGASRLVAGRALAGRLPDPSGKGGAEAPRSAAPSGAGDRQRDEVNRHRLTRANLSWASAGLDTGRPGYTLNHTVQPHNEGDFTSMGRVVGGMDVVDRIELGDRVPRTRMLPDGR
jgi:cyclophilin family peptidyl-prolyl cis-trans isomerase